MYFPQKNGGLMKKNEERQEYEEKPVIGVSLISRVSCHGKAFYLYVNKDSAEAYKIFPEDKIEVHLGRHWKPIRTEPAEPPKKVKGKKEEE
jgi:hypothetical protein